MKEQKDYNKVFAVNTETHDVYILNYTFFRNDGNFKGATGAVLSPYAQKMIDERKDVDELIDKLMITVTLEELREQSLRELAEQELSMIPEDEFPFMDTSYVEYITDEDTEKFNELFDMDIVNYECIGSGRCFNVEMFDNKDIVILDKDAVIDIIKCETDD